MPEKMTTPYRLALRLEGNMWNAYFAKVDSMEDAVLIGSIARACVEDSAERKQAFMELMKACLNDIIEVVLGIRPDFIVERPAPEWECGGDA